MAGTVEVTPGGGGGWQHTVEHHPCPRRPFYRLGLDVTALPTPEAVMQAVRDTWPRCLRAASALPWWICGSTAPSASPSALDLNGVALAIEEATEALKALVRNHAVPSQGPGSTDDGADPAALEQRSSVRPSPRTPLPLRSDALARLAAGSSRWRCGDAGRDGVPAVLSEPAAIGEDEGA